MPCDTCVPNTYLNLSFLFLIYCLFPPAGLQGFTRITSNPVNVNLTLTLPAVQLRLPLTSDPRLSTTVSPPVAHSGPGPVHARLISHELRDGQVRPAGGGRGALLSYQWQV